MLHFDSDYMEGAHPAILQRLLDTNLDQTTGYGSDPYTARAARLILDACAQPDGKVFFFVGGTPANATTIDGLLSSVGGVMAAETGHINVHEGGAIEASGHKVIALPSHDGKVSADDVAHYVDAFYADASNEHMTPPEVLYISQPTELGTLYSLAELESLSRVCRERSIPLYLDGARLGYGLAADGNDAQLQDIARLADVFYIGGTKVGALFGEACVVPRPTLLPRFVTLMKQHGAILAKGRLLGLQFETLFTDGLYGRIARNAIEQAMRLKRAFTAKGYRLAVDSPTNQQFFILPNEVLDRLAQTATFEVWGARGETETMVRFVTSWATTPQAIDELIAAL